MRFDNKVEAALHQIQFQLTQAFMANNRYDIHDVKKHLKEASEMMWHLTDAIDIELDRFEDEQNMRDLNG